MKKCSIQSARSACWNQVETVPAAQSCWSCKRQFFFFFFKCKSLRYVLDLYRVIFALGVSMTLLNAPLEWLSLGFEWKWMLLFEDVQQGVFYSTLFCFWIIFCGEHLMVSTFFYFPPHFSIHSSLNLLNNKPFRTKVRGIVCQRTGGRSGWWCSALLCSSYLT